MTTSKYSSPELVVVGRADVVVMGRVGPPPYDHIGSMDSRPVQGLALGLDD